MTGDMCCSVKLGEYWLYRALYCFCQDLEFWSAMGTSSVDIDKWLSKNFFPMDTMSKKTLTCFFVMIYLSVAYDMTPFGGLFHCCGNGVPFLHLGDFITLFCSWSSGR